MHPDPAVIGLAEQIELEVQAFRTDLFLDADVFALLGSVDGQPLDDGAQRMLDEALRDFRRAGVDRDEETRERVRTLDQRLTDLGQAFDRNIRDGRRTTLVPAAALDGLPEDFVAGHAPNEDGLVAITTEYPDLLPFLTFARDAVARRQVAHSFFNLAWPENDAVLEELLATRHEKATLLGYASWPDYDAETKMIGTGDAIGAFVDRISDEADAAGRREIATLLERAATEGEDTIDLANWRYYHEAVKREQYGVDAQEVRRYFDFGKVHDGLLDVTSMLFGLTYTQVDQAEARTWHPDVTTYDVGLGHPDGTTEVLGRIHLDLHPRERKFNHAAQFDLAPGVLNRQLPEGVLVCNLPRGLMDHRDVVTLFHEFGHLMHHVLAGRHEWVRFSGVATEWDFVEAPSQMLEEWAWDAHVLQGFATDADGTPIPDDLVRRMRAAEEFGRGLPGAHADVLRGARLPLPPRAPRGPRGPDARAVRRVQPGAAAPGHPLRDQLRAPLRLHLGVLHLHVEPGDREGPVQRVRPRRPVRRRGRDALPRPGAGSGWVEGRGRARGGLPGPCLQHGRVHGVAERVTSS